MQGHTGALMIKCQTQRFLETYVFSRLVPSSSIHAANANYDHILIEKFNVLNLILKQSWLIRLIFLQKPKR